jgi:hypothetical protein
MLNHKSLTSTQVYARLSVAPVRSALDDQAERMLGLVPVPVSEVVPLSAPIARRYRLRSTKQSGRDKSLKWAKNILN